MMNNFSKKWEKEAVSTELWFNRNFKVLPEFKLQEFDSNVFASYTGPDCGLAFLQNLENPLNYRAATKRKDSDMPDSKLIAGCQKWSLKNRKAYGISMSLYDQHPLNGKITGDPIADCFGLCARGNTSLMVVADGVNWGEKSRLAARCAVYGAMKHINEELFLNDKKDSDEIVDRTDEGEGELLVEEDDGVKEAKDGKECHLTTSSLAEELGIDQGREDSMRETTKDLFRFMLASMESAHKTILEHEGGLTTLCICFVCPIANPSDHPSSPLEDELPCPPIKKFAACVVNVGDSLAFVFSRRHGVREITTGSHDVTLERNIRDAGGALGPVTETGEPELNNLTCSITCVEAGDVIFLATDGITDNFDPVVTKIAVAKKVEVQTPPLQNIRTETALKNEITQIKDMSILESSTEEHITTGKEVFSENDTKDEVTSILKLDADEEEAIVKVMNESGTSSAQNPITEVSDISEGESKVIHQSNLDDIELNPPSVENVASIEDHFASGRGKRIFTTESEELTGDTEDGRHELSEVFEIQDMRSIESPGLENGKPVMLPFERHRYAIKEMERIIHEFELFTECPCSAQELCGALLQHVLKLTDTKRKVLENPDLYGKKKRLRAEERQNRDSEIVQKLALSPGKLDHATVIGYEVGCYHGNEDDNYCYN